MTTDVFAFTGAFQTFVVPPGVTTLTVNAFGAAGGTGNDVAIAGGLGGRVQCDLTVIPGETLRIYVGGAGQKSQFGTDALGGFNGGGVGDSSAGFFGGGGGGGATDIRRSPYALADRLVAAGGGGGGGVHFVGGGGGTPTGIKGGDVTYGGNPGTQLAGGTAGPGGGSNGTLGVGGAGNSFVGGGGGGLYGGGAGGGTGGARGGGGGGSGFSTGVNETVANAVRAGAGELSLTYTPPPSGIVFPAAVGFSITPTTSVPFRQAPRREYIWISDLSGEQIGVIR